MCFNPISLLKVPSEKVYRCRGESELILMFFYLKKKSQIYKSENVLTYVICNKYVDFSKLSCDFFKHTR